MAIFLSALQIPGCENETFCDTGGLIGMHTLRTKPAHKKIRQVERRLNVWLLPVLSLVLLALYLLSGFKGWLIFTIGIGGAWLLALFWILSLERTLRIERKVDLAWATVGESVPEEIKLVNRGILPALWVELTDESSSIESPLRLVSEAAQHSRRSRHFNHIFKRRGLYTLGPTRLRCGDPFGIYTLTMKDQHSSSILVTPPVLPLSDLKLPTGGLTGDERHRRGYIGRNINDVGLRNYTPGDSLKHIHWRASAHFDDLIVRQLETATSRDWLMYVDLDRNVQAGIGENSTLELCIVLAASLALRGLREHRKVGMLLAGPHHVWIEPGSGPTQRWHILRILASAEAGKHSLVDLMARQQYSQAATTIVITPSTDPIWVAGAFRQRKADSIVALLVDPTDFGSPLGQENVVAALLRSRIPFTRMPSLLLKKAYSASTQSSRRQISYGEQGRRYFKPGRQNWQSTD
jgi:uncharacterized protein (DUF58 family)